MKHIYFCSKYKPELGAEYGGIAVVAESEEEALRLSNKGYADDLLRDKDAEELPIGEVDNFEGLKRQIYGWIEGKCPSCDNPDQYAKLLYDEDSGKIYCALCE